MKNHPNLPLEKAARDLWKTLVKKFGIETVPEGDIVGFEVILKVLDKACEDAYWQGHNDATDQYESESQP